MLHHEFFFISVNFSFVLILFISFIFLLDPIFYLSAFKLRK